MKKKTVSKLCLNRNVISALSQVNLEKLKGGAISGATDRYTDGPPISHLDCPTGYCTISCNPCPSVNPFC